MDMNAFLNLLLSSSNPLLPDPAALRWALHGVWAVVLGSGTLLLAGKLALPYRIGLAGSAMVWTALPGAVSPAYWLGLAFQTPSLMSAVICLGWLLGGAVPLDPSSNSGPARLRANGNEGIGAVFEIPGTALKILSLIGVVLGWVLLLDTLALLPVSIYAWGFNSAAVAAVAVCAALLWVALGSVGSALPLLVLTLFVLSRLPTGNLWDALLDPWLWLALQVGWFTRVARCLMGARRLSPATRV